MKIIILFFITFFCSIVIYGQNSFIGKLSYENKTYFETKEDSLNYLDFFKDKDPVAIKIFLTKYRPIKDEYLITKDTILISDFTDNLIDPTEIYVITSKSFLEINVTSAKISPTKIYQTKKYLNIKNYKRIPNEDAIIKEKKCLAWKSKNKYGWKKIWLSDVTAISPNNKFSRVILNKKLILKSIEFHSKIKMFEEKKLNRLMREKSINFSTIISKHTYSNIKEKYAPIKENLSISNAHLKKGDKFPDLYYRGIFSNKKERFYDHINQSKYTIIELWGTWCGPCLIANEKIKKLRIKYDQNHLKIISINVGDNNIEKIKKKIKEKNMNWEHGFSTKKLISILNKKGSYPRLLIINKKNEVIFTGNPQVDFEEIQNLLKQ